jgi:N-acetylglutamate synthase-like GNAT family acetyltransferase
MNWTLRAARPDEADALVALLMRSKAVWGYDAAFLAETRRQAARAITPDYIASHPVFLANTASSLAGFYSLCPWNNDAQGLEMDWLFVEPAQMGRGLGRALGQHAIATARSLGASHLWVVSDPNAEGFYASLGMIRAGEHESSVVPGRMLPVLRLDLA